MEGLNGGQSLQELASKEAGVAQTTYKHTVTETIESTSPNWAPPHRQVIKQVVPTPWLVGILGTIGTGFIVGGVAIYKGFQRMFKFEQKLEKK